MSRTAAEVAGYCAAAHFHFHTAHQCLSRINLEDCVGATVMLLQQVIHDMGERVPAQRTPVWAWDLFGLCFLLYGLFSAIAYWVDAGETMRLRWNVGIGVACERRK